ncbi:hypothetical protein FIV02_18400 [Pseudomonas sp. THAF187a]|nr:hypothetical protein FIV02_18400 [Pseudomonas sp. THAF187a]QFT43736.1 hypothetical protein FIU98_18385 [Pseudomonas sp. THAF42]
MNARYKNLDIQPLFSPFDYLFSFSAKRNGRLPRDNSNALLGWQYSQIIGIREDL